MKHTPETLAGLFLLSSAYAGLLQKIHHIYTRRFTWLTVVVGDGFTLIGPAVWLRCNRQRLTPAEYCAMRKMLLFVYAGFFATGIPIITWQVGNSLDRQRNTQPASEASQE